MVMPGDRDRALEVWRNDDVVVTSTDQSIVLSPKSGGITTGLVFIPGAKVDPYSYMFTLSGVVVERGITVVITKPALNLAFFDLHSFDDYAADAPGIDRWFVGGHSLGGVRACQLAGEGDSADSNLVGLVLFGSYCANDLSNTDLNVLSLAASNDGLSSANKISDAAGLLPRDARFIELEGANHASFGDYGVQPGDGEAEIDSDAARRLITNALSAIVD
ncbi:alpha/beta hydrolase [Glaciihabitans arcticus]|uniref:Alpha/beta hydrolase n=2 Tax=Glaciihabitans arcticus TaxID=2668039 RepID=A0A4Q9GW89_9MICO|nr:alpha/beta hydrolase [Glaciihabitans arcticus]